jgi:hypothetical protein
MLADNDNYDLGLESTQRIMEEKSADLLTVIIKFFNSALIYFSKDFFGKLVKVRTNN